MKIIFFDILILSLLFVGCSSDPIEAPEEREPVVNEQQQEPEPDEPGTDQLMVIKPYSENPRYWQYQNEPVLLLGATNNDNLFQSPDMKQQLDLLSSVGGNYVRNTMSSRDDGDVWPFFKQEDGLYDLERWNDEYWNRFKELIETADENDVIVQIEIWDRFDYSQDPWQLNPFNPKNNVNYTESESGLKEDYPHHPAGDIQPFFHVVEGMQRYSPELEVVKKYQQKFVEKILSYTLDHGNVLYCMNNETNTDPVWGQYWLDFVDSVAGSNEIYISDMFDLFYKPQSCEDCLKAISQPNEYTFIDASQVNSRNVDQAHWDTLTYVLAQRESYNLRPVNSVKVYGNDKRGVERFSRDVIGGYASVRYHRPELGNGQNEAALASIKAVRKIESVVKFWDIESRQDLLSERGSNEAYLAANEGTDYVLLFPSDGAIKLDMKNYPGKFYGRWMSIESGEWGEQFEIEGGDEVEVKAPGSGGWFVVITDQNVF